MEVADGGREVPVVAAVVVRHGRFLLALRPRGKRHGGTWEFPGGKRRSGEGDVEALRRELREELQVEVTRPGRVLHAARDPEAPFRVRFVQAEIRGEPRALEHEEVGWFPPESLAELPLAPADRDFVRRALPGARPGDAGMEPDAP